jgi:hypothetical protein
MRGIVVKPATTPRTDAERLTGVVEELDHAECVAALRRASFGRIAVSQDALPLILPVNFAYDETHIVFRTRAGGILDRACRNTIVAFEIDDFDIASGSGWSVSVVGVANVLHRGEWLRALELGLISAGAGEGSVFVAIKPGVMTGRRVAAKPAAGRPGPDPV